MSNRDEFPWFMVVILIIAIILTAIGATSEAAEAPEGIACGEGCEEYTQRLRLIETGNPAKTCWQQTDIAQFDDLWWDFEVLQFPDGEIATLSNHDIERPTENNPEYCHFWTPVHAGLYSIRVRACDPLDGDDTSECSRWSESWNPNHTAGSGIIWYIKLQAPTGGTVE